MNRNLKNNNKNSNIEKDGIIIISFNQNKKLLEFSLPLKKISFKLN